MVSAVVEHGGAIEAVYACEHRPEDGCDCRKPSPGLLRRAAEDLGFDLASAYVVGDHSTDVEAAHAAQAQAVLVLSGRQASLRGSGPKPDFVVGDLMAAAELVVSRHNGLEAVQLERRKAQA